MSHSTLDLTAEWSAITSVALLGTDRRSPAPPTAGPLADLLADARLCEAVVGPADELAVMAVALAVARRAGLTPGPAMQVEPPPPADHRPMLTAAAAARWHTVVREWPVLEDELLVRAVRAGWRLSPDVLVAMLRRHRTDSQRRALVLAAAGPVAPWLVARFPALGPATRSAGSERTIATRVVPSELALPELPLPAPLAALLDEERIDAFGGVLDDLRNGGVGAAHRAVLVNLCARVRPEVLGPLAEALGGVQPTQPTVGMALALADLCCTRAAMLEVLA